MSDAEVSMYRWTETEPPVFDEHLDELTDPDKRLPLQAITAGIFFGQVHRWSHASEDRDEVVASALGDDEQVRDASRQQQREMLVLLALLVFVVVALSAES